MNDKEILDIIKTEDKSKIEKLFADARVLCDTHYGKSVYIRGLIEITNYCKNDCYYCGLRCSNKNIERYRLSLDEILKCCRTAEKLGIKTFVLQGGEDTWFTRERVVEMITLIRKEFPDHLQLNQCAITLSLGERSEDDYISFYRAGVNRYLLRHETADENHYAKLHPSSLSCTERKNALFTLKRIGYQTGAGFMVGSPHQTPFTLLKDIRSLEELQPQMIGIGPFIPQKDTPFGVKQPGDFNLSLKMIALSRLLLPKALIPATTAMETISPNGRELAIKAGANVVMPNLTPSNEKKHYAIYDNKSSGTDDAEENLLLMTEMIKKAGYIPDMSRGDAK